MDSFDVIKLNQLPLVSITGNSAVTIPVVLDNSYVGRTSTSSILNSTCKIVNAPSSKDSAGEPNYISSDQSSFYFYNAGWKKVLAYTNNWDDIDSNARVLLTNKILSLSSTEKSNVFSSIGLGIASSDNLGLVKPRLYSEIDGSCSVQFTTSGELYVKGATSTEPGVVTVWDGENGLVPTVEWVNSKIDNIPAITYPVATSTSLGCILSDGENGIFNVSEDGNVTIASATIEKYGIVKLSDIVAAGDNGVVTSNTVYAFVTEQLSTIYGPATESKPGLVRPSVQGLWESGSSHVGPIYIKSADGTIDIYAASENTPGVVLCLDSMPDQVTTKPYSETLSVLGIKAYVASAIKDMVVTVSIPVATSATAGAVLPDSSVFSYSTDTGFLTIEQASNIKEGVVLLATDLNDAIEDYDSCVTTAKQIKDYVTDKVQGISQQQQSTETKVDSLVTDYTEILNSIAELNTSVTTLSSKLEDLTARVTALENK